ncbi:hypothetical protein [Lentzea sp. NPDC003310]|uniref:hypothetical protein n=1 Tax=Lentzea sp. NPDC003310 TaxID=3154447 RepID=UPI0033A6B3CE
MLNGRRLATTTAPGVVRLVVVLGVLFGLIVVQAAPCLDRVDVSGHGTISVVVSSDAASVDQVEAAASSTPLNAPAGLVGLCVVVLLVVLFVMAGLERLSRLIAVLTRPGGRRPVFRRRRPTPDLDVLCVLRA